MESTRQKTVLIVDDTPENLAVLDGILSTHYRVKAAPNGRIALKIASQTPPPDIILLDIMMPEMDGYAVLEALKKEDTTKAIPVVFVSAKGESSEKEKGLQAGAVEFLAKPVDPEKVEATIKRYCL